MESTSTSNQQILFNMSTSENNQSKKEPLSADYQEVHHKKNAFVVGDRAYMWKNEKGKAIKV